jgi:2-C-methyl-D-erythritol 4-phosphate cytidylyltransferase
MVHASPNQSVPKQYLPLAGRTVIEWSIAACLAGADVTGVIVVLAVDDVGFSAVASKESRVRTTVGGAQRADSVLKGLQALNADANDWVLVHDAARPCLHESDVRRLVAELIDDAVGGLLAVPVSDTLKAADASLRVSSTVSRDRLWRALTPQMFRYGLLLRALQAAADAEAAVTDEAAAVERLGLQPKLVVGRADNIKVTMPEDLAHAEFILSSRLAQR